MPIHREQKKIISFIIPLFNEAENIKPLAQELLSFFNAQKEYEFEAILVDNASKDTTYQELQKVTKNDQRLKVLQLTRNVLADGALSAGMQFIKGDAAVLMMGDRQEPVKIVGQFLKKWEEGYEIVYGVVKKRTAGLLINIGAFFFYRVMSIATGRAFPENVADFRLIDRSVVNVINEMPEQNKYLRGLTIWTGFTHIGVPFNRRPRSAGESKATFQGLMSVAQNGIFSFSYLPLRFVSFLGFFMTLISFLALIANLVVVIVVGRKTPGVATIVLLMLLLFGMLFFILGIMSEYIARIYEEAKRRPNYIVKSKINL